MLIRKKSHFEESVSIYSKFCDFCRAPVNKLVELNRNMLASGDDDGCIKIWDLRTRDCVVEWTEHTDFISDMTTNGSRDTLLATGYVHSPRNFLGIVQERSRNFLRTFFQENNIL